MWEQRCCLCDLFWGGFDTIQPPNWSSKYDHRTARFPGPPFGRGTDLLLGTLVGRDAFSKRLPGRTCMLGVALRRSWWPANICSNGWSPRFFIDGDGILGPTLQVAAGGVAP